MDLYTKEGRYYLDGSEVSREHFERLLDQREPFKYKNPWYDRTKPNSDGTGARGKQGRYNLAYYYCDTAPEVYKRYYIFHRVNHFEPSANVFDVVKGGECITQRAGLDGAKRAIDEHIKQERAERLEGCTLHKYANGGGGFSYTWADKNLNAVGIEATAEEIVEHERNGAFNG